jgi:hypothetical protein
MGRAYVVTPSRGRETQTRGCECFNLAKAYTNKAYQEKEERYNMKNENQCIL